MATATFNHGDLTAALHKASRATGKGTNLLPILSHVALRVDRMDGTGLALLTACDMQQQVTTRVDDLPAVDGPIAVALDGTLLATFLSSVPGSAITLSVNDRHVATVSGAGAKARIHGLDLEDFPTWPALGAGTTITVSGADLKRAIALASVSVARDETRPVLAGINIRVSREYGGCVQFGSADGFRAGLVRIPFTDTSVAVDEDFALNVIVPASSLRTLAGLIGDEAVDLTIAGRQIASAGDGWTWASVLIAGTFPDVGAIFPREFAYTLEVDRKALQTAVKAAAPFVKDNNDVIRFRDPGGSDEIVISGISDGAGDVEYIIPAVLACSPVLGDIPETALNAAYLAEVLGALGTAEVTIRGNGRTQAVQVTSDDAPGFRHLIMPMVIGS